MHAITTQRVEAACSGGKLLNMMCQPRLVFLLACSDRTRAWNYRAQAFGQLTLQGLALPEWHQFT